MNENRQKALEKYRKNHKQVNINLSLDEYAALVFLCENIHGFHGLTVSEVTKILLSDIVSELVKLLKF